MRRHNQIEKISEVGVSVQPTSRRVTPAMEEVTRTSVPRSVPNLGGPSRPSARPERRVSPLAGFLKRSRRDIEEEAEERAEEFVSKPKSPCQRKVRGGLVMLCGLPAAGKSTLSRRLLEHPAHLREALNVPYVRVWHLSFDAVLARLEAERGARGFDPQLWHEAREHAFAVVRSHCERLGRAGDGASSVSSTPAAPTAVPATPAAPAAPASPAAPSAPASLAALATSATDGLAATDSECFEVLVLDDNMQYRSMRRAYYRLARDHRLGLCTLCLPLSTEEAIARDAQRAEGEHVGAATISLMAEALQWPDPERQPWEAGVVRLAPPPAPPADAWSVAAQLAACLSAPVAAEAVDVAARAADFAASQQQTAESAVHQLDLRLRKAIASHLQSGAAKALAGPARTALAKRLGERKKEALLAARVRTADGSGAAAGRAVTCDSADGVDASVDALEQLFVSSLSLRGGSGDAAVALG